MNANHFSVYVLMDPDNREVRYVGYTGVELKSRLLDHIKPNKLNRPSRKNAWIKSLINDNKRPIIEALYENLSREDALDLEIKTIAAYRRLGIRLTNLTDGGDGGMGYKFSPEKIEEMVKKRIGKKRGPCSEERRKNISAALKGRKMSEEQKVKLRGRKPSDETRRLISIGNKGKTVSAESRAKMSKSRMGHVGYMTGKTHTEEWKKKMSEKFSGQKNPMYGRKNSDKDRERLRVVNIGNKNASGKRTPEQIERVREGMRLAKERRANAISI